MGTSSSREIDTLAYRCASGHPKTSAEFVFCPVDREQLQQSVIRAVNGEAIDKSELDIAFARITDGDPGPADMLREREAAAAEGGLG